MASTGDAIDFGNLTQARSSMKGTASSPIRGVFAGGYKTPGISDVIDYITIDTLGDAVDFGDIIASQSYGAGCSDSHGGLG